MVHQRGIRTHTKREAASTDSRPGIAVDTPRYSTKRPLFDKASAIRESFRYSTKRPLFNKASAIRQSFRYSTKLQLFNEASAIQQKRQLFNATSAIQQIPLLLGFLCGDNFFPPPSSRRPGNCSCVPSARNLHKHPPVISTRACCRPQICSGGSDVEFCTTPNTGCARRLQTRGAGAPWHSGRHSAASCMSSSIGTGAPASQMAGRTLAREG